MRENTSIAERSIDLEDVRPIAVDGGTALLARTYRETESGIEIDAGEQPVAVVGVYSEIDLRRSLENAGFDKWFVIHALNVEFRGENATRLVSIAEQAAGHAEVFA